MIPTLNLNPNPESDFQLFGNSGSGFESSKKWNRSTSSLNFVHHVPDKQE